MELLRSVGLQRELPVIGLTANVIALDLERFNASGVDRVCHKADATKKSQIDRVLDFAREHLRLRRSGPRRDVASGGAASGAPMAGPAGKSADEFRKAQSVGETA